MAFIQEMQKARERETRAGIRPKPCVIVLVNELSGLLVYFIQLHVANQFLLLTHIDQHHSQPLYPTTVMNIGFAQRWMAWALDRQT